MCVVFFAVEISKTVDMYMFLFDDILLLTKVKKPPRKVGKLNLYEQAVCLYFLFILRGRSHIRCTLLRCAMYKRHC